MAARLYIFLLLACLISLTVCCPSGCLCTTVQVNCQAQSVTSFPAVASSVTELNLASNPFSSSRLLRSNFTGMAKLEKLRLKGCALEYIEPNAFSGLPNLKLLDLSLNNIQTITDGLFSGLHLDYLFLGDNTNLRLPNSAFQGMTTKVLSLENCDLLDVDPALFYPLSDTLKKLFLSNNKIARFSKNMLSIFNQLDALRIYENPLLCECDTRWLKEFYDENPDRIRDSQTGSQQEPRCNSPEAVAGQFFNRLTLADFHCEQPSLTASLSFTQSKGTLTCRSHGKPLPKVSWYRPNGIVVESAPQANMEYNRASVEVFNTDPDIHGQYRCVAFSDFGNTSLTVNVTWPFELNKNHPPTPVNCLPALGAQTDSPQEIEITNKRTEDDDNNQDEGIFKTKYFTLIDMICAVFGTFIATLIVSVIVLHFCVYRKRRPSLQYSTPPLSEYSSGSVKNATYHQAVHPMQNRPLPNKPYPKMYDENHYMSTNLDERDDFLFLGQHSQQQMSPACEACRTMSSNQSS